MKTSYGRLALAAFCLLVFALLFLPMRAGEEDSLNLSPAKLKMSVGDSYVISCGLSSDKPDQRIRFTSSDDRIAAINNDGTIYAYASGEAVITAKASGGASAKTVVTVAGIPLDQLSLNTDELHIRKGQYSGLKAEYNSDASDTRLQWTSLNDSIATVDTAGRILGVGGGMTYVSVSAPNGAAASARVFVDVDSTAVHISPYELTLGEGADVQLKVSYLPLDSTDSVKRWASSDSRIAYVDEDAVLHAKSIGTAYISVYTADGLSTGMQVIVEAAPKDLQLEPAKATLERGDSLDMQVIFLQKSGNVNENVSHHVLWTSSDPTVASVDQNGHVTALKSGSAKITASSDGLTAVCRLKVQVNIHEIRLDRDEVYLLREEAAEPIQLQWVIDPVDADDPTVHFRSNNEQVARVSDTGLVRMTGGYGTAVITASCASGAEAQFTVNVVTHMPGQEPSAEYSAEPADDTWTDDAEQTEDVLPAAESVNDAQPAHEDGGTPDTEVIFNDPYEEDDAWIADPSDAVDAWTSDGISEAAEVWDTGENFGDDSDNDFGGEAEDYDGDTYAEFLQDDRPVDPETLFDN